MSAALILALLAGCGGPSPQELAAVDYAPRSNGDWPVSTPEEQGLDPKLVAELYYNASHLETIYSLLLFKNGHLIAKDYFHVGSPGQKVNIHSVTKSINSALACCTDWLSKAIRPCGSHGSARTRRIMPRSNWKVGTG